MQPGQVLRIETSDPMALVDIPHFCTEAGHRLLSSVSGPQAQVFVIERGQSNAD